MVKLVLGDLNHTKGKESYPSLACEYIFNFDHRICHVHGPQFGTRNDKHIVKMDERVKFIGADYSDAEWNYFDEQGNKGVYLICDNGYLQWPTLICPFRYLSATLLWSLVSPPTLRV
jgi:hypothetical protein